MGIVYIQNDPFCMGDSTFYFAQKGRTEIELSRYLCLNRIKFDPVVQTVSKFRSIQER